MILVSSWIPSGPSSPPPGIGSLGSGSGSVPPGTPSGPSSGPLPGTGSGSDISSILLLCGIKFSTTGLT